MAARTIRICVCGDEGTGKSSLVAAMVKNAFVAGKIQSVLPPVIVPPMLGNAGMTIVDTSPRVRDRDVLRKELRKCNVILLVYSDNYSYERIALFWLPHFRSLGVNVPVVLCANKADLAGPHAAAPRNTAAAAAAAGHASSGPSANAATAIEDEMGPVMAEFREIDSCIRSSAKELQNVVEAVYLCQKAVMHPIAPLFDHKEGQLKPACVNALKRVFYLTDKDQDGFLDDHEMFEFQAKSFDKDLSQAELDGIKAVINKAVPGSYAERGLSFRGFLHLNKMYAETGRHETIWVVLRKHRYTDSLSLEDAFLHPKVEVPEYGSAELSPAGYQFFADLFIIFDKDKDGVLNDEELAALFAPTPGLPRSWKDADFPSCTVRNEAGHVTLQGWLAQWSMTTYLEPKTTLEYLAYLGFEASNPRDSTTASALKITKPRKRNRRSGKVERNVVLCFVVGAPGAGKSSLIDAFLNRPFNPAWRPTLQPRRGVNTVELPGGKQVYLILEELGQLFETAILENQARLDAADLICYAYDSSDPDSFAHVVKLRRTLKGAPHALDELPAVYTGLKADCDKTTQRSELQPDAYAATFGANAPLHVSVTWGGIGELGVALAEAATNPSSAFSKSDEPPPDRSGLYMALGAIACAGLAVLLIWRRSRGGG